MRFLGRKVYLGAVVILISAMRQGPTPRRVRELSSLFGVDRATIARWQTFWRDHVSQTPFWKIARGRLVPVVEIVALPLSILEAFLRSGDDTPGLGESPAVSVANYDQGRTNDRDLAMIDDYPQRMHRRGS